LVCKLNTRCSIIAATNTKGKYDPNVGLDVNIALGTPLISRFDLIMVLVDSAQTGWDEKISDFILSQEAPAAEKCMFDLKKMQAYLAIIKKKKPTMTDSANRILKNYYRKQRSSDIRNASRTTIRLLESLIRLSQAHAKLTYQEQVTVLDAIVVVMLNERSIMSCLGSISVLHEGFPDNYTQFYQEAVQILTELQCDDLLMHLGHFNEEMNQMPNISTLGEFKDPIDFNPNFNMENYDSQENGISKEIATTQQSYVTAVSWPDTIRPSPNPLNLTSTCSQSNIGTQLEQSGIDLFPFEDAFGSDEEISIGILGSSINRLGGKQTSQIDQVTCISPINDSEMKLTEDIEKNDLFGSNSQDQSQASGFGLEKFRFKRR
jgi:DNA helicase MCM9